MLSNNAGSSLTYYPLTWLIVFLQIIIRKYTLCVYVWTQKIALRLTTDCTAMMCFARHSAGDKRGDRWFLSLSLCPVSPLHNSHQPASAPCCCTSPSPPSASASSPPPARSRPPSPKRMRMTPPPPRSARWTSYLNGNMRETRPFIPSKCHRERLVVKFYWFPMGIKIWHSGVRKELK